MNLRLWKLENPGNQLQCRVVRMILVSRIEPPQLLQILKFVDLIFRLPVDIHLQFI